MDLFRRWRRLWRVEPVEIVSSLSAEAVEARLVAGLTTRRQLPAGRRGDPAARVVTGRACGGKVSLTALPRSVSNSWSPYFRGRLVSAGAGCRLVGTIAWHPYTRVGTAVYLAVLGLFIVGASVLYGWSATGGRVAGSEVPLALVLAPAALFAGIVGLVSVASTLGWRDADFLRGWLADRVQAPGRPELANVEP